ncbi:hypothetical protein KIW84_025221 [Lathyrus oleraceus]|uniref:DUF659 domain-containing protein n=1 Tax=Pisum sativum TaxID=3888 RepID=A0A9D4YNF3_PEA|nr:hypothetical protein KIW84_025221 [Pisum sativum]
MVMCDMISRHGNGLKPPSYHDLRIKLLNLEVKLTHEALEEYRKEWRNICCIIMTDGWTDPKRRKFLNFLVNSLKGIVFFNSVDASNICKTIDKIFEMIDVVVEEVGEDNVVQVVIDNAENYKVVGEMLMRKRNKLYWTPCIAHCLDLMLEDLEKKISIHEETIPKGCLYENKKAFIRMFTSKEWKSSKCAKLRDGKTIEDVGLDKKNWKNVVLCLRSATPLIKVLRLVDSDQKPTMKINL